MRKFVLLLMVVVFGGQMQAQNKPEFQDFTVYYLFNAGYRYQNISYFEAGLDAYLVQPNNNIIDAGLSVSLGAPSNNFLAVPQAHVGYLFNLKNSLLDPYSSTMKSPFWLLRGSVSPWHVTPEAGITILSLIEITAGYGFEFREHNDVDLEGFKFGFNLKLPFLLFWND